MHILVKDKEGRYEINLLGLIKFLYGKRKLMIVIVGCSGLIGLLYSFTIEETYAANAKFIIENNDSKSSSIVGQLAGFADLAGVNLQGSSEFGPEVYEDIIQSRGFLNQLLEEEVAFAKYDIKNLKGFYDNHYSRPLFEEILHKIASFKKFILGDESNEISIDTQEDVLFISKEENYKYEDLSSRIKLEFLENGILVLTFSFPDQYASANLTLICKELIEDRIVKYRTQKLKETLNYIESSYETQKDKVDDAQGKVTDFLSKNYNINSPYQQSIIKNLQDNLAIQNEIFLAIAKNKEETLLNLQKQTPSFTLLDKVLIPIERTSPKRIKTGIYFGLFGAFLFISYLILMLAIRQNTKTSGSDE